MKRTKRTPEENRRLIEECKRLIAQLRAERPHLPHGI